MQHLGHPTIHHLHTEGAMTSLGLGTINYQNAAGRRRDLLAEAERNRQAGQARSARATVTDSVGLWVIRIGELIARPAARPGLTGRPSTDVAVAGR